MAGREQQRRLRLPREDSKVAGVVEEGMGAGAGENRSKRSSGLAGPGWTMG